MENENIAIYAERCMERQLPAKGLICSVLHWFHALVVLFLVVGPFVMPLGALPVYLIAFGVFVVLDRMFQGECILTLLEKELCDRIPPNRTFVEHELRRLGYWERMTPTQWKRVMLIVPAVALFVGLVRFYLGMRRGAFVV